MVLQKKGIPTVTVVTSEFVSLARFHAKARGFPDLPLVVVPHPFNTLSSDEVLRIAEEKFDELIACLVGGVDKAVSVS